MRTAVAKCAATSPHAGFDARLIHANLDKLMSLVRGLRSGTNPSSWEDYRTTCSYDDGDTTQKDDFVRRVVSRRRRRSHGTSDATTAGSHASQPPART